MNDGEQEKSGYEKADEDLKKIIETELLERKKIKLVKDAIVEKVTERKNDYLESLDKNHNLRMEKINSNDDLLEHALKSESAEDLKKVFQKILDDSKKK